MNTLIAVGATLLARGAAAAGGIVFSILVARMVGADGLGRFAVFLSLLGAMGILAKRGQDMLLIREVAGSVEGGGTPVRLLFSSLGRIGPSTIAVAVAGAILLVSGLLGGPLPGSGAAFLLALPLFAALALVSGYLKGAGRAWAAPIFEIGGLSVIASILLGLAYLFHLPVTLQILPWLLVTAMAIVALVGFAVIWRDADRPPWRLFIAIRTTGHKPGTGENEFMLIALSGFLVQAGSFLLASPFLSAETLGLVRAAERLSLIVSFPVLAIEPVIAPRIVRYVRAADGVSLRHLVGWAMGAGAAIGLIPLTVMLIAPGSVLLLMGTGFSAAAPYLRVLALVQFLVAIFGPLLMVLSMGGGERAAMWVSIAILSLAVIAYPALIWMFGAIGFIGAYSALTLGKLAMVGLLSRRLLTKSMTARES